MITRGYFLGEIIDSLSNVAQQVDTRCTLGLTDLNKYLEDFFLFILNESLKLDLVNCNDERSNAPGIDLLDSAKGIAFQITSTKTSKKVNDTLRKAGELEDPPNKIYILVIGKKQSSYSLKKKLCKPFNFKTKNIWDINSLSKKLIELPIDSLQIIYDYVRKELARVKIDLEIPNDEGEFPTSIKNFVEQLPKPILTDFTIYHSYLETEYGSCELTLEDVQEEFKTFSTELANLPRLTRDFYAFLLERRDEDNRDSNTSWRFNYNRLKRICHFSALDEEITLLSEHGFGCLNEPESHDESPYVSMSFKGKSGYFLMELVQFIEDKKIGFTKPIVNLDFTKFGI